MLHDCTERGRLHPRVETAVAELESEVRIKMEKGCFSHAVPRFYLYWIYWDEVLRNESMAVLSEKKLPQK